MLPAGLEVSTSVQVDDTGARHQGHNGFCTHIGNELFAYFESTDSKSRQNFLEVLHGVQTEYTVNDVAVTYGQRQKLAQAVIERLMAGAPRWADKAAWQAYLAAQEVTDPRHVWIGTGPQVSVRESRRVKGVYVLTEEDALNGRTYDDAVAWRSGYLDPGGQKGGRFVKMKIHDVPYRALVPETLDGLLMAGRCLSATHVAAAVGKSMGNCPGDRPHGRRRGGPVCPPESPAPRTERAHPAGRVTRRRRELRYQGSGTEEPDGF